MAISDYELNSTTAQLWRYMQHQEEVQHARHEGTFFIRYVCEDGLLDSPDHDRYAHGFAVNHHWST